MNWKIFFLFGLLFCLTVFESSGSLDPGPPDETCNQNTYPDFPFDLVHAKTLPVTVETPPTPSEDILSFCASSELIKAYNPIFAASGMHYARGEIEKSQDAIPMELLEALIHQQESSVPPDLL